MSDKDQDNGSLGEQWSGFQKIWTESFMRMMQMSAGGSEAAPPEFLRQLRSGMFQALAQSWDQFLRSPQFLETLRQWMDQAVAFRKLSSEFFTEVHREAQSPSQEDLGAVLAALRQFEKRVLPRLEEISWRIAELDQRTEGLPAGAPAAAKKRATQAMPAGARKPRRASRK
jgi:hypothetical protein